MERLTYSIAEAVELTGLSLATVQRHLRDGRLPSVLVGRRRLIPARELEAFVTGVPDTPGGMEKSSGRVGPVPAPPREIFPPSQPPQTKEDQLSDREDGGGTVTEVNMGQEGA